jgi:hypothetical protein
VDVVITDSEGNTLTLTTDAASWIKEKDGRKVLNEHLRGPFLFISIA